MHRKSKAFSSAPCTSHNNTGGRVCWIWIYRSAICRPSMGDWFTQEYQRWQDNRIRCVKYRLGSLLEQSVDGWLQVVPGISASYQYEGVASCLSSPPDNRGEQEENQCSPNNNETHPLIHSYVESSRVANTKNSHQLLRNFKPRNIFLSKKTQKVHTRSVGKDGSISS